MKMSYQKTEIKTWYEEAIRYLYFDLEVLEASKRSKMDFYFLFFIFWFLITECNGVTYESLGPLIAFDRLSHLPWPDRGSRAMSHRSETPHFAKI